MIRKFVVIFTYDKCHYDIMAIEVIDDALKIKARISLGGTGGENNQ